MKTCYIYTRVSTEEQAEHGQSLEAQEKVCKQFAKDNGLKVLDIFQDPGRSGSDPNRPGLRDLVKRCEEDQRVDTIITQDIDRLARDTLLFLSIFKDFQESGIAVKFVNQPNVDGGIDGMLVGTIQAAVSTYAAKQTGRKAKATMTEKAKAGWYPSWAPIGYTNTNNPKPTNQIDKKIVVPDPERASAIKKVFKLYATGNYSILDLQNWLSDTGFRTRKGKRIAYSTLGKVLTSPFYYGWMKWGDVERQGNHKPLIDKETFDLCKYVAAKHRNFASRKRKHNFLLRGFVFCKACGMRYTAEWHTINSKKYDRIAYYHCNMRTGCKQPYVEMTDLETQVENQFKKLQFSKDFIDLVAEKTREVFETSREEIEGEKRGLVNRRSGLEAKRNKLEDMLLDDTIDRQTFKRKHAELQREIDTLNNQIEEVDRKHNFDVSLIGEVLGLTRNIYRTYKEASPELKRHYLRFFFEKIYAENKRICEVKVSPFFAALQENRAVIIRDKWLRGLDSNQQPSGYT